MRRLHVLSLWSSARAIVERIADEGPQTNRELSAALKQHCVMRCRALINAGWLARCDDGSYALTPDACAALDRHEHDLAHPTEYREAIATVVSADTAAALARAREKYAHTSHVAHHHALGVPSRRAIKDRRK